MERYADGQAAQVGDLVRIGASGQGTVVACIAAGKFSSSHTAQHWGYLGSGLLVDTDYGGLVHFAAEKGEAIVLIRRRSHAP